MRPEEVRGIGSFTQLKLGVNENWDRTNMQIVPKAVYSDTASDEVGMLLISQFALR